MFTHVIIPSIPPLFSRLFLYWISYWYIPKYAFYFSLNMLNPYEFLIHPKVYDLCIFPLISEWNSIHSLLWSIAGVRIIDLCITLYHWYFIIIDQHIPAKRKHNQWENHDQNIVCQCSKQYAILPRISLLDIGSEKSKLDWAVLQRNLKTDLHNNDNRYIPPAIRRYEIEVADRWVFPAESFIGFIFKCYHKKHKWLNTGIISFVYSNNMFLW